METPNTVNTRANSLTLQQEFSPDIIMFLNSVTEPEMRYLIALFQKEKASSSSILKPAELQPESQIAAITAEQRQALQELEDFQPIEIEGNSTQILRELRDNA
jgi:hypothetical protein